MSISRHKFATINKLILGCGLMVMAGVMTDCSAKSPCQKTSHNLAADSVVTKALGDSVCSIIEKARTMRLFTVTAPDDTVNTPGSVIVPMKDRSLVKFIITNPDDYESDVVTYGIFVPQFGVQFATRKEEVSIYYDFGLRKWQLRNAKGDVLLERDLKSGNMFRFARTAFPDDKFFNSLPQTENKQ